MEGRVLCSTYVVSPPYHTVAPACVACCCLSGRLCPEHMRPQAPAYLRIPYTTYPPALACYWVRRPQYVRENIIQGWYRGTYTSVLGTYRTYTTRLGTVLRYVPSAQIDLGTVPNTAYRTGYRTVGTHLGRNPYHFRHARLGTWQQQQAAP